MVAKKEYCPMEPTLAYQKNGIIYVPHYRSRAWFVGPGYGLTNETAYTANQMEEAGAEQISLPLWVRPQFGESTI